MSTTAPTLVLASRSAIRGKLLADAGIAFTTDAADVDEEALGRAILEGDGTVATAVAVRHRKPEEGPGAPDIVSPCGACRELLMDYAPDAMVIVPGPAGPEKRPARAMLPLPYRR